jgi:hypothetical protein
MGDPMMRLVANQLGVRPLVTRDLKLSEEALLETVRASNSDQRRALGHREDASREPRRVFMWVTGAVLGGSEPPKLSNICEVGLDQNDFEDAPQGERQQYHP